MHPRLTRGWSRLIAILAVASVTSLVALQAPTSPGSGTDGLRTVATERAATQHVALKRHRGRVTGNGRTVYVANRTTFRPGRTRVGLPPRIRARAWAVVDLDTGRILGGHRARAHLPQASTIKLLTALTAVRTVSRTKPHKATRFEAHQVCTCAGLRPGRLYRRNTLLAGMLLPSGNDAAEALAGSHPHGRWAFYRAMNRIADQLGAHDTVVRNASGLTAWGSHSSARDLVIFLRAALANKTVSGVMAKSRARIATAAGRFPHTVWRGTDYVNMYPGSLGKSGYTTPAKNTLVVATPIAGHRIAVATLGSPGGYSTSGARRLTEWAAANYAGLRAVGRIPKA